MSTAVVPPLAGIGFETRKKFTRDEVEQMLEAGVFSGKRLELIDGDLIDKMGQKPPHASAFQLVMEWLVSRFGVVRVRGQLPIDAAVQDRERNVPEPDIAVLIEKKPDFLRRHPRGTELLLVVEVAETSLSRDTTIKRDLYARAGVPEYWVIDLEGRRVMVHRAPFQGIYAQITTHGENESIALESEPAHSIAVSGLLP